MIKERCITVYCKFKDKKTITITGIYRPAAQNPEFKEVIQTIINHIRILLDNDANTHHIFLRDFNEDPKKHQHTPILEELSLSNMVNLTEFLDLGTYTWLNYRNTHRTLDYIVTFSELLSRSVNIYTNTTHEHFETDHQAIIALLDLNYILLENSEAKRRKRYRTFNLILDKEKNKDKQLRKVL